MIEEYQYQVSLAMILKRSDLHFKKNKSAKSA